MTDSPEQAEQHVAATTDEVGRTLEALKRELTTPRLASAATTAARRLGRRAAHRLAREARANPVPLALAGVVVVALGVAGGLIASRPRA